MVRHNTVGETLVNGGNENFPYSVKQAEGLKYSQKFAEFIDIWPLLF